MATAVTVFFIFGHGRTAGIVGCGHPTTSPASALRRIVSAVIVVVAFVVVIIIFVVVTAAAALVVFVVVTMVTMMPSVDDAVVVIVVVVAMVVMSVTYNGISDSSSAGRVVLDGGGHEGRGCPVTVEPGLQELVCGQEMVTRVYQTGRIQWRTAAETGQRRWGWRLVMLLLLMLVVQMVWRRPAATVVVVMLRMVTNGRGCRSVLVL